VCGREGGIARSITRIQGVFEGRLPLCDGIPTDICESEYAGLLGLGIAS
jgi:hypothetical protein